MAGELPAAFGPYQVRRVLGRGWGIVYLAHDPKLNRDVAVKVLNHAALSDPRAVQRLRREASVLAQMHHNHIIPVFQLDEQDGVPFIVSKYIPGQALADAIPEQGMQPERAVGLVIQLLDGLAYAHEPTHEKGVVLHRDVKPANALLDAEGRLYLTDFGLASWLGRETGRMTRDGDVMGTPAYMAPEQARGDVRRVGPAADQYAAGVVLYELLTGHLPFEGAPPAVLLYNVMSTPPPRPSEWRRDLDPRLEQICLKALAKQPGQRFASCRAFADTLRGWLAEPIDAQLAKSPSQRSGAAQPAAAVPAGPAPGMRQRASAGSDPAGRAKRPAATRRVPEAGAQGSRKWLVPPLVGLLLLIAVAAGLWFSGLFRLWLTPDEGNAAEHALMGGYRFVHFGPDGPRVVLRFNDEGQKQYFARVYDLASGAAVSPPLPHDGTVRDAALSPDGKRVVTLLDKTVRVWDAATGEALTPPLKHEYSVRHAAFSPDGKKVVTTNTNEARVWDAATGKEVTPLLDTGKNYGLFSTFSPDGKRIITGCAAEKEGSEVRVWDAATGKEVTPPLQHQGTVCHAAFSPDSERIVTVDGTTARVWGAANGKAIASVRHEGTVWHAAFSPDSKRVVSASDDNTARVWDAATGETLASLPHGGQVNWAAFSADGVRVVTCGRDKTGAKIARLWDATSGLSAGPPLNHDDSVIRATFSPDGKQLVTQCSDGTLRLWDAQTGQELKKLTMFRGETKDEKKK
jgi:DNA-binding beta-propeller fold protein YncE